MKFKEVRPDLPPYNAAEFERAVQTLPKMSSGDPAQYQQQIAAKLAKSGAAILYLAEVEGCRVHGVTCWIDGHPVIQFSGRGKSDAEFWFSLMHEIHHVLHGPHEDLLMQEPVIKVNDPQEVAAFSSLHALDTVDR